MTLCATGRHWWTDPEDALRCCNPRYKRCLAVEDRPPEEARPRAVPGIRTRCWHYWLDLEPEKD